MPSRVLSLRLLPAPPAGRMIFRPPEGGAMKTVVSQLSDPARKAPSSGDAGAEFARLPDAVEVAVHGQKFSEFDLEYDPEDYARLLEPIVAGQADIVYGSRFLCQSIGKSMGQSVAMAWQNRLANRILTAVANLLYSAQLTDEATAYKAFRAAVLNRIHFQCRRFEFCPEVTAKARRLGYRIHEVPVSYNARGIAEGKKIRARDGWEALWTLLRYRFTPRARL